MEWRMIWIDMEYLMALGGGIHYLDQIFGGMISAGQIIATKLPVGHTKWWWKGREVSPKMPETFMFSNYRYL